LRSDSASAQAVQGRAELTETQRFASVNALKEASQGQNDLESFASVLLSLLKGFLPWMRLRLRAGGRKWNQICEMKVKRTVEEFCLGLPIGLGACESERENAGNKEESASGGAAAEGNCRWF
jgi:hypothetical protein